MRPLIDREIVLVNPKSIIPIGRIAPFEQIKYTGRKIILLPLPSSAST